MSWEEEAMEKFDGFEYTKKDLIGHGAFAIVYKGRYADVSFFLHFLFIHANGAGAVVCGATHSPEPS